MNVAETSANRLMVARLLESGDHVQPFRLNPDLPLGGYGLVGADEQTCRITIYVENGRTLSSRQVGEPFYYEAWLVGRDGSMSLGAFNLGPTGEGSTTIFRDSVTMKLDGDVGIRITAEPFGGSDAGFIHMLEGPLVWLEGAPAMEATPVAAAPAVEATPESDREEAQIPVMVLAVNAELDDETNETNETVETNDPEVQAVPLFLNIPEPSVPVAGITIPRYLTAQLQAVHPLAPRANGTASIVTADGSFTLALRGLPSPATLGRQPGQDRPYNTYRVWLVQQRTGTRMSLGVCSRVWGENFRFQSDPALPLTRYDQILVTADDRGAAPTPQSSQVLLGSYHISQA
jgi:hypothetical protein